MRISRFKNAKDDQPERWEGDWGEFCTHIVGTTHTLWPGDKLKSPAFSPAEYPSNSKRGKANVIQLWLAVLDYDGIPVSRLAEIEALCEGTRYLLYTSYSHTPGKTARVRLVFDLDRPVPASEWPKFWAALAATLPDSSLDQSCKDASRLYFLAYTPRPDDGLIAVYDGLPLCVDEVLGAAPSTTVAARTGLPKSQIVDLRDLEAHAKKLTRRSDPNDANMGLWFLKIAHKDPYAEKPHRHDTAATITARLERDFPYTAVEDLARLFEGSLTAMRTEDFEPATELQDITRLLQGARDKRLLEGAKRAEQADAVQAGEIRSAFQSPRSEPYTQEEIEAFARAAGVDTEVFCRLWVVAKGPSHYIFVDGEYRAPVPYTGLATATRRDLAPAASVGVKLDRPGENGGKWVRKSREDLLADYGTEARHAVASYLAPHSYYDINTQTIYEAVCPPRELEPVYSEEVNEWLRILSGDYFEALQLWLKLAWDLNEPLAALYFEGSPGAGKDLFAHGVSRIWGTNGPTDAEAATGKYREMLLNNPVIYANETLPKAWSARNGQAAFREFVAERVRPLERKYLASVPLIGCTRIILAANNTDLLRSDEILSENDRSAIVERLFHVHVTEDAVNYLKLLGAKRVRAFVHDDELAKHAAWLRDNFQAERQGRFGVSVGKTDLHEAMKHGQRINAAVGEWLIGYLLDNERANKTRTSRANILVRNGELWANINALRNQRVWEHYVSNPRDVPSSYHLGRALAELAPARTKYKGVQYRVVDLPSLFALAERTQLATRDELEGQLLSLNKVADLEVN